MARECPYRVMTNYTYKFGANELVVEDSYQYFMACTGPHCSFYNEEENKCENPRGRVFQ